MLEFTTCKWIEVRCSLSCNYVVDLYVTWWPRFFKAMNNCCNVCIKMLNIHIIISHLVQQIISLLGRLTWLVLVIHSLLVFMFYRNLLFPLWNKKRFTNNKYFQNYSSKLRWNLVPLQRNQHIDISIYQLLSLLLVNKQTLMNYTYT